MNKAMQILLYSLGGIAIIYAILTLASVLYGTTTMGYIFSSKKPNKENTLGTYLCDGLEIQLVHEYKEGGPGHMFERLVFKSKKDKSFIRVSSIVYDSYYDKEGWFYDDLPTYHLSKDLQIKKLSDFTIDYKTARAWNVYLEKEEVDFDTFSSCLIKNSEEINNALKSFIPNKGKESAPLKLNMIINHHDLYANWFTWNEQTTVPGYKVTMEKQGDTYFPVVSKLDYNNYPDNKNINSYGHEWYIYKSDTSGPVPSIEELKSAVNKKGQTLDERISDFKNSYQLIFEHAI